MSKISEVIYAQVDPKRYSVEKASEYFFYINLLNYDSRLNYEYENYELEQTYVRNEILSEKIKEMKVHPNMNECIFGVSSMNKKAIIISEIS